MGIEKSSDHRGKPFLEVKRRPKLLTKKYELIIGENEYDRRPRIKCSQPMVSWSGFILSAYSVVASGIAAK